MVAKKYLADEHACFDIEQTSHQIMEYSLEVRFRVGGVGGSDGCDGRCLFSVQDDFIR